MTMDPIRDLEEALRITGGSRELADELFSQFLGELPAQISEAEVLLANGAHSELRDLLHQIRGGASVCAVKPFIQALDELHQEVKFSGDFNKTMALMEMLRQRTDELFADRPDVGDGQASGSS